LSVAFEHPKSSPPPAQAVPLSVGNMIAAAKSPFETQLFILDLHSFGSQPDRTPLNESAL